MRSYEPRSRSRNNWQIFLSLSLFLFNLINIDFVFLFFRISNRVLREEKKKGVIKDCNCGVQTNIRTSRILSFREIFAPHLIRET